MKNYESILTETRGKVGIITINRSAVLNALNDVVMVDVVDAAQAFDLDRDIGAIVLTGSERAFAAGGDITQMAGLSYVEASMSNVFSGWKAFTELRTPTIAAVAGWALGGGCELAMMCDFIIAADTARFGQPEVNLGIIPGLGGTQRLTRAVGKAKAMELVLTGRTMGAEEAERSGLVARVVPVSDLMTEALASADSIASKSLPVLYAAKEAVNAAFETTLSEGIRFERKSFFSLFALNDQKEGMAAFAEKREPRFTNT